MTILQRREIYIEILENFDKVLANTYGVCGALSRAQLQRRIFIEHHFPEWYAQKPFFADTYGAWWSLGTKRGARKRKAALKRAIMLTLKD